MKLTRITNKLFLASLLLLVITGLAAAAKDVGKTKFMAAESAYSKLRKSPGKQKYRDNWLNCIKKYRSVYRYDPDGPWAAAGMFKAGLLYYELYNRSGMTADRKEALDILNRVGERYPKSRYRQKAKTEISRITRKTSLKKTSKRKYDKPRPSTPPVKQPVARKKTAPPPPTTKVPSKKSGPALVTDLRFWSNPNYTRVVVDIGEDTAYAHRLLRKDPKLKKPQRLVVDVKNARLGSGIKKFVPINDNLLKDIRAGQFTQDKVRVVMDINSFNNYKIFSLKNPFRIVIDVWGSRGSSPTAGKVSPAVPVPRKQNGKIAPSAIARQLALGVRRIVIDPGHGGRDYGAPGYLKGVHEKNIVLTLSKKLAKKIEAELNCEVILTRTNNTFLTLEERTAIANTKNADLFISLHTNASRNRRAYGMETYYLNLATDDESIRVAALENATSTKNISDLQSILLDLMQNAKINESSRLAAYVQSAMHTKLRKDYSRIKNKGVKQAPFYVLLGAQMPAILIETAFISNPRECKRLTSAAYQDKLCNAIVTGIKKYIQETNPTAFLSRHPTSKSKGG